jgi:hypothetical protein
MTIKCPKLCSAMRAVWPGASKRAAWLTVSCSRLLDIREGPTNYLLSFIIYFSYFIFYLLSFDHSWKALKAFYFITIKT